MTDRWFAPHEIKFRLDQVIWLLENLLYIRLGYWPTRPSNYTDPNIQKSPSRHAPYETPIQIGAELEIRLENAGQDGAMCKMRYVYGEDIETIARHWHIDSWWTEKRIERALKYCCGWKRKGKYEQRWMVKSH